jgi:hypothetical protein
VRDRLAEVGIGQIFASTAQWRELPLRLAWVSAARELWMGKYVRKWMEMETTDWSRKAVARPKGKIVPTHQSSWISVQAKAGTAASFQEHVSYHPPPLFR